MEATFFGHKHPEVREKIVVGEWEEDVKRLIYVAAHEDELLEGAVLSETIASAILNLDEAELLGKSILALVENLRARPKGA
jgi:hypothetical protein